jgi:hypothetical protein
MNTGLIQNEPIADYHGSAAVSHTKLEVFRDPDRGPARFAGRYITKTIPAPSSSDAMDIGQAVDSLVLERRTAFAELPATYMSKGKKKGDPDVEKPFTLASNTCKAIVADIESKGLIALNRFDVALVRAMFAAVFDNPTAAALLSKGVAQTTWRARFASFHLQIRPDWWNHEGVTLPGGQQIPAYLCDLKSAEDMGQFLSNRRNFGYDRQAALYREVVRMVLADMAEVEVEEIPAPPFYFIVVFKNAPVQCAVLEPSAEDLEQAREEVVTDLRYLKRCYDDGKWPGVLGGVQTLPRMWRKAA